MLDQNMPAQTWPPSTREIRGHALLVAAVMWLVAAWLLATPTLLDRLNQLKGRDFVFFYTLGYLVNTGQTSAMYDMTAERAVRATLVPESAPDAFASAYPPQTALIFSPFARLPFPYSLAAWMLVTAFAYVFVFYAAAERLQLQSPDRHALVSAAIAFPPFWNLVLGGQSTIFPFLGLALGWFALERGSKLLAGIAFGLLAVKPQLAIPFAIVMVWHREWRVIAGALISITAQLAFVVLLVGSGAIGRYVEVLRDAERIRRLLQPHAYQVHSLQALTDLLPGWPGVSVWLLLSAAVIIAAVVTWRRSLPTGVRLGVIALAAILASPHLLTYDVTMLALPLVWFGAWVFDERRRYFGEFLAVVYLLFVTLLGPFAALVRIQPSVIVMLYLMIRLEAWSRPAD